MSWLTVDPGAPFGTTELPYGIFSRFGGPPSVGVAVGDQVLDLAGMGDEEVTNRIADGMLEAIAPYLGGSSWPR